MALSKVLQHCSLKNLGRDGCDGECSNDFVSAKDLGIADTLVQVNPGRGSRKETYQINRNSC